MFNKYFLTVYYVTEVDTTPVPMELSIKSEKQNVEGCILCKLIYVIQTEEKMWGDKSIQVNSIDES